ncbi:hypothetical protein EI94DRAFT_1703082 [Lactarius quietus]|nr:hypothetical protein EI94DRAFT_1703082 [Lactarius quietus]
MLNEFCKVFGVALSPSAHSSVDAESGQRDLGFQFLDLDPSESMDIEASTKERIKILQGRIKANILADVRGKHSFSVLCEGKEAEALSRGASLSGPSVERLRNNVLPLLVGASVKLSRSLIGPFGFSHPLFLDAVPLLSHTPISSLPTLTTLLVPAHPSPLALPSPWPTPLALLGRLAWPGLVPWPTHGRRQHWQPLHLCRPNMSTSRSGRRQPHCCPHQHLNSSHLTPPNLVGDCNAKAAVVATKATMATSATMWDEDHRKVNECTRVNDNV